MKILSTEDIIKIKNGDNTPLGKVYLETKTFCIVNLHKYNEYAIEDIEDSFSDAIIILREKIIQGKYENNNLPSYILQITHNKLRNKYKRKYKSNSFDLEKVEQYFWKQKQELSWTVSVFKMNKKIKAIIIAFKSLKEGCYQLLYQHLREGIPLKELKDSLGYSTYNSIRSAASRCKKKLILKTEEILANTH